MRATTSSVAQIVPASARPAAAGTSSGSLVWITARPAQSTSSLHPELDSGSVTRCMPDSMCLGLKVRCLGPEDVGHPRLRIPVVQWEPGALDLHHEPVALPEGVALLVQVHRKAQRTVRLKWPRLGEALPITSPYDLVRHHELVTTLVPVFRHAV